MDVGWLLSDCLVIVLGMSLLCVMLLWGVVCVVFCVVLLCASCVCVAYCCVLWLFQTRAEESDAYVAPP